MIAYLCSPLGKQGGIGSGKGIVSETSEKIKIAKTIGSKKLLLTFALPSAMKGKKRDGNERFTGSDKGHK
jgi:hypothetical protein